MRIAVAAALGVASAITAARAAQRDVLRVAIKPIPPFVYTDGPVPRGFSIELWNHVAESLGVDTEFVLYEAVNEIIAATEKGFVDAGIAAITINVDREARVDFSHPYYRSGLRIAVPSRGGPTFVGTMSRFLSPDLLAMLTMLLGLTLLAAHFLWLIERGVNPECFPAGYLAGVGEALWWSVATIITGGCENKAPISLLGRLVAVAWMLGSIVLVASFTATLTSQMTAETVANAITGPESLPGRIVATVGGTSVVDDLRERNARIRECFDLADGMRDVTEGRAEAVVFDAPVLAHAIREDGDGRLRLVGPLFEQHDYGIVLPPGSSLRKAVNTAILSLGETDKLAELKFRWFGDDE